MSNPIRNVVCCFLIAAHSDLFPSGFLVACQATNFSFPDFNGAEANRLVMLGDAESENASVYLNRMFYSNTTPYSCGKVLYRDGVKMQDPSSGEVASFSTSFTFELMLNRSVDMFRRYKNSDGFAFLFATDTWNIAPSGEYVAAEILCVEKTVSSTRLFAVEVDTWLNKIDSDPSDSHIAVDVNSVVHNAQATEFVYDLCRFSQNSSYCGYFAKNTGPFTIWIDYNGTMQALDVRFAPGPSSGTKPANASIHIAELDLSAALNEVMYVGFSGSFGIYREAHRILSWNFSSSGLSSAPSRSNSVGLQSGVWLACATIIPLGIFFFWCCGRGKSDPGRESTLMLHLMGPRIFAYRELSKATKGFSESELLESGGFGAVYKGTLPPPAGAMVAVKRCTRPGKAHAEEDFVAEATSISQIRHRNLVQLQGWCEERGELLLVCDYMPNRSLDAWLFKDDCEDRVLTWELRHNILAGVAAALAHLHEEWQQCVLHRDVKSSNVLLDGDFNAHLGDFGLVRLIDHHKAEKTTMMAGTLGYMAPEMSYTGKATKESDVYSFGVLTLEVVCGKRPLDVRAVRLNPADADGVLVDCVWRAHETGDLLSVVDPRLGTRDHIAMLSSNGIALEEDEEEEAGSGSTASGPNSVEDVLRLGLLCCQLNPSKRPSMRLVNQMLQTGDGAALPPLPATKPPMPYAFSSPTFVVASSPHRRVPVHDRSMI